MTPDGGAGTAVRVPSSRLTWASMCHDGKRSVSLSQDVAVIEADLVFGRILARAGAEEAVRLVVVTSTRARPEGPPDELSDYDVIVAMEDLARFDPVAAYGTPAASWGDEHDVHGVTASFRGVIYEDGVKVDWMLWPPSVPGLIAEHGLTDKLDVGYRVLLDKDGATQRWAEPTFRAHIPAKPSRARVRRTRRRVLVERDVYRQRPCARGQEFYARFVPMYDVIGVLLRMLAWLVELDRTGAGSRARPVATSRRNYQVIWQESFGSARLLSPGRRSVPSRCQDGRRTARLQLPPALRRRRLCVLREARPESRVLAPDRGRDESRDSSPAPVFRNDS